MNSTPLFEIGAPLPGLGVCYPLFLWRV